MMQTLTIAPEPAISARPKPPRQAAGSGFGEAMRAAARADQSGTSAPDAHRSAPSRPVEDAPSRPAAQVATDPTPAQTRPDTPPSDIVPPQPAAARTPHADPQPDLPPPSTMADTAPDPAAAAIPGEAPPVPPAPVIPAGPVGVPPTHVAMEDADALLVPTNDNPVTRSAVIEAGRRHAPTKGAPGVHPLPQPVPQAVTGDTEARPLPPAPVETEIADLGRVAVEAPRPTATAAAPAQTAPMAEPKSDPVPAPLPPVSPPGARLTRPTDRGASGSSGNDAKPPGDVPQHQSASRPAAEASFEKIVEDLSAKPRAGDLATAPKPPRQQPMTRQAPPPPPMALPVGDTMMVQPQLTAGYTNLPTAITSVDAAAAASTQTAYADRARMPQPAVQQAAVQITRAVQEGVDRVSVQLKPAALGRISIELEVGHDNRVIAVIAAERTETLELMQRDAKALEHALSQAGLKTDSGSLSFNLRGGNDRQDPGSDGDDTRNVALSFADETDPSTMEFVQHQSASRHGGIDIRI